MGRQRSRENRFSGPASQPTKEPCERPELFVLCSLRPDAVLIFVDQLRFCFAPRQQPSSPANGYRHRLHFAINDAGVCRFVAQGKLLLVSRTAAITAASISTGAAALF